MKTVEDVLMVKGPDVIVAASDYTVLEAAKLMVQAKVGAVVVMDGDQIKGIFTERDLLKKVVAAGKDPAQTLLSSVMTASVRTCRLGDDIKACAEVMTKEHIRHLVVAEEGKLIGLVGLRDLLKL
jgi:CBS domain-containing protein